VIQIAPDVSGLIQKVEVRDNQTVKRGDVLFTIDQDRFTLALRQAKATLAERQETLAQAQREAQRNRKLGNLVAAEQLEESQSREARARSAVSRRRWRWTCPAQPRPLGDAQPGGRLPQRPRAA
jgi:multidrug resistance efflux pump